MLLPRLRFLTKNQKLLGEVLLNVAFMSCHLEVILVMVQIQTSARIWKSSYLALGHTQAVYTQNPLEVLKME